MPRDNNVKKSNFIAQTAVQAGDYFDFLRNGQNFKIGYTDFVTSLGVSGTLQVLGESSGIPVLYVNGGVNYIRNIIDGSGITSSLSLENGVEIAHNFLVDTTGTAVIIDETALQPTVRSIVGGTGITVTAAGDTIEISLT